MKFPDPPRGLRAIPWRLPIWFFRLGLGWLFGNRALLLIHTGRKSGKTRQTVLEVVKHIPEEASFLVASGFGTKSDWYQNVTANPEVKIQVGLKRTAAVAQQLSQDQAEEIFLEYVSKNPQVFRSLAKMIGYEIEHTEAGYRAFGREIPIIRISPRHV